jgi:uncharacterized repeat protein (TIGR01451 family)
MKRTLCRSLTAGALLLATAVLPAAAEEASAPVAKAQSPVVITTRSLQLKRVKTKEGKVVKKWLKATKVVPGDVVRYVNTVLNRSDKPIEKVRVTNPVNPHLSYVAKSARCSGKCAIRYSIDGGKHFDTPEHLYIKDKKGKKRLASPKEYNAIEWVIDRIEPGKSVETEFKARLK